MSTIVTAPIAEVTVYTDRARITRSGSVTLTAGEHIIQVADLPITIVEDSVRASGKGAHVRILSADVTRQFVAAPPEQALAELKKELEALEDRDTALADDEKVVASRLKFLESLRDASSASLASGVAYGRASMESVASLAQYLDEQMASSLARQRELSAVRRELAHEIEVVRGKLSQRWDVPERRQIEVVVEASEEAVLELEVTYTAFGASWRPLYDVRLVDSGVSVGYLVDDQVSVGYLANVQQRTGEDWPPVRLALSTARPAISTTIPELHPWFIDVYRPPVPVQAAAPMMMRAAAAPSVPPPEMMAAADERGTLYDAAPPEAEAFKAEVESAGATVTYRVARPIAVPSDGSPHKTTVASLDMEAQLDYVTVPKLAEEAYLRAKIKNTSQLILLPGSANIFHGPDFIGTTFLETVVPNEEFEAQLGVDDRIKVERKLAGRSASKTIIGDTRRTIFSYKITITSHLDKPARMTVWDQLPVSRHEQIKVKLQEVRPELTEQSNLNILKWEFELQPQQTQELTFTFAVEHPRDVRVSGLGL